jgi:type II secretory pathway pseudopilin PulG
MVAITLLALMVVAAGSLIVYQSSTGRESTQRRTAGESLGLAMMMIRQDVMHAGYGLPDNAQTEDRIMRLAVWLEDAVNDSKGSWYRELYVNNGRYVLIDSLSTSPAIISSGLLTGTQWTTINSKLTPYDVGCLLLVNESTGLDPVDSDTGRQTRRLKFSGTPTFTAPSTYTYDLSPAAAAVFTYAPGICYKLEPFDASAGYEATTNPYTKLVRNGRTPDGKSQVILGGDPNFRVVDFRVRAMFYGKKKPALGPPDNEIWRRWSPGPPPPPYVMKLDDNSNSHDFNMLYPEDLRFLEILIGYQNSKPCGASDTKDPAGVCWGPTFYRTMQVSPRNMVLNAYDRTS